MPRPGVREGTLRAAGTVLSLILAMAAPAGMVQAAGCSTGPAGPATGWLHLRTNGYFFQSAGEGDAVVDRAGAYQEFDAALAGLAGGRAALRFSGRLADDLKLSERVTDPSRLYVGHLEFRPIPKLTARLGRQFVQEGPTGLTLDGLWLVTRPCPLGEVRLWGGARATPGRTFEFGSLDEGAAWGARVLATTPCRMFRLGASCAYRESGGEVTARPVGFEAQLMRLPWVRGLRATGRASYDLHAETWDRTEALAQWRPGAALPSIAVHLVDRRASIDPRSYFARFDGRVRVGRASARYDYRRGFGAEAEWVGSFAEGRTATRIGGALLLPVGRVGYSARVGAAGEESRWFGDVGYAARPWLRLEAGATLVTYALIEDASEADERDLTTAYGRADLRPRDGVGLVLEIQNVTNPDAERDIRFLVGLDLITGFGASRFGLRPGCCSQTTGGR
jgi:hypothetical protein